MGADPKAKRVRITDDGSYYTGTEVETALQEIGAGNLLDTLPAHLIPKTDNT